MNQHSKSPRLAATLGLMGLGICLAPSPSAQIVITSKDMFNQVGLYYRAYANTGDVVVTGRLGTVGGPQSWDFTQGPTDEIFRFDYVPVNDEEKGKEFPKATFAERKTDMSTGKKAWMYLEQIPGLGRMNYGFYDADFSSVQPSHPFSAPILDFPDVINYQDIWTTSTSFKTEIVVFDNGGDEDGLGLNDLEEEEPGGGGGSFSIPAILNYSSSAKADAFGIVNQPGIGFEDCLRVNELVEYVIQVDLFGDGNFQTIATEYVRNYYWLRRDNGIAVQITSKQQNTPPSENFSLAAAFVRMFESNHPKGDSIVGATGISDLKITFGGTRVLLNWAKTAGASSYRVEYNDDPSKTDGWVTLETTASTFAVDATISGVERRFYRIVGVR